MASRVDDAGDGNGYLFSTLRASVGELHVQVPSSVPYEILPCPGPSRRRAAFLIRVIAAALEPAGPPIRLADPLELSVTLLLTPQQPRPHQASSLSPGSLLPC